MWPERCVLSMTFVFLVLCPGLSRFSHLTPKARGGGAGGNQSWDHSPAKSFLRVPNFVHEGERGTSESSLSVEAAVSSQDSSKERAGFPQHETTGIHWKLEHGSQPSLWQETQGSGLTITS